MTPTLNILATVRNPALLPAALLVFKTLRTGFPTWNIRVWGNGLAGGSNAAVMQATHAVGGQYIHIQSVSHDEWIERLIQTESHPFAICDTDMVFWEELESVLPTPELISGRFEPGFDEPLTGCWHVERLHTCLMLLNPQAIRAATRDWMARHVPSVFPNAETQFIRQHFVPRINATPLFYDSMAGLWQACKGGPFGEIQNARFEHLHCGTYADVMSGCDALKDLQAFHSAVYADTEMARGLRLKQQEWYEERGCGPFWWQRAPGQIIKEEEHAVSK